MNSNGWKIVAFSLLLGWIGICRGFADVVPVSISQQVSISGSVLACDYFCKNLNYIQDPGNGFSSADTNSQLPPKDFALNESAIDSVLLQAENYTRTASVEASASQSSTLTPTHFSVDLSVDGQLQGTDTLMQGTVNADSRYLLVFHLTSQSFVHLTGGIDGGTLTFDPPHGDGSVKGEIHLSGPGFQFDQAPSFPYESNFDEVFTLGPGQYTLNLVSAVNRDQGYYIDSFRVLVCR